MWNAACFTENWKAWKGDEITTEEKLRNSLAHIFAGVRHEDEGPSAEYPEGEITKLASRDMVDAAIVTSMLDDQYRVPMALQDVLLDTLLNIRSITMEDLLSTGRQKHGKGLLGSPAIDHVLLAAAFQAGNRDLVRDIITETKAPEGGSVLFSGAQSHWIKFGDTTGWGHAALDGQKDNACDLIVDLMKAGWAIPDKEMLDWAQDSTSFEAAKALLDTLSQHGVSLKHMNPTQRVLRQDPRMLELIMAHYPPEDLDEETQFSLIRRATSEAANPEVRIKNLEVLWKHGVRAYNWRLQKSSKEVGDQKDITWDRTALHAAVDADDERAVEWLLEHGAMAFPDRHEKNPHQYAKERKNGEVLEVFRRYPQNINQDASLEYKGGLP